jgi:hypothetical protein
MLITLLIVITLCDKENGCHYQAELFLTTRDYLLTPAEFIPDQLYELIGSSFEKAVESDKRNGN